MKVNYWLLSALCFAASVPFAIYVLRRPMPSDQPPVVRIATLRLGLGRAAPGALLTELRGGKCEPAQRLAAIVQRADVDVVLLGDLDVDDAGEVVVAFAREYLAVSQFGQHAIEFAWHFAPLGNAGVPTGVGSDVQAPGAFAGQHGMALLSKHPLDLEHVRTFTTLPWSRMPEARRPAGASDAAWAAQRLSSAGHWDVPLHVPGGDIHLLCSMPPLPRDEQSADAARNHDEVRFWSDYLAIERAAWIVDDRGAQGGLAATAHCVVLGSLGADPIDGPGPRDAIAQLLASPRLLDAQPGSVGAETAAKQQWGANATQKGDARLDTADLDDVPGRGPGNLRLDYVLASRSLQIVGATVLWPRPFETATAWCAATPYRIVTADVAFRAAAK